jgi:phosphoribosyl 1,2-cyclic phosphodiesterase
MNLIFLGTRGGIKLRSPEHYYHSSLLITRGSQRIMLDCGADWLGTLSIIKPTAILITHAHPDHSKGLRYGAPCPVYATRQTQALLAHYPLTDRIIITNEEPFRCGSLLFTAYTLEHSLIAPAVGYRVTDGTFTFFYVPDLVAIHNRSKALKGVALYIGDGATLNRTLLIRRRDKHLIGHAPFSRQLAWCQEEQIPHAIITHCGSEIIKADPRLLQKKIQDLAATYHLTVTLAYDGMVIPLPRSVTHA